MGARAPGSRINLPRVFTRLHDFILQGEICEEALYLRPEHHADKQMSPWCWISGAITDGRDPPDCGLSVSLLVDIPKSQSSIYLPPISNKKEARHRAQLGAMWSSSPTSATSVDKDRGPVLLFSQSQPYRPWFKCGETDISSPHMNCAGTMDSAPRSLGPQKDPPGVEFCRGSWSPGSSWCKLQQPSIEPAIMNE
jgi:hypothetical protein